jgi:2-polyprenyl-6-hydroxyphenyl methylase/3-demethylubiquinone-9 3-methyltransferase
MNEEEINRLIEAQVKKRTLDAEKKKQEEPTPPASPINNTIYETYGDRWYTAQDDPIALLRAESRLRNPWVAEQIRKKFPERKAEDIHVLDIGCGGGFLTNYLAKEGFIVFGIDTARDALECADRHDVTQSIKYIVGDAYNLPFSDGCFEVVCAMDFLEHVEDPDRILEETSRVLAPGGIFLYYTFNRNWLANLIVIKGVEWFVKNTPKDMHVLRYFLKPDELTKLCEKYGLKVVGMCGIQPKFFSKPFLHMLKTGTVADDFEFQITGSTTISLLGSASKT